MSTQELPTAAPANNEIDQVTTSMRNVGIVSEGNTESRTASRGKGKGVVGQQGEEDAAENTQDTASVTSSCTVATQILTEPYQPGSSSQAPSTTPPTAVSVTVPVYTHYKFRELPGPVGNDVRTHGIFATRDFRAGTRIIHEAPLIALRSQDNNITHLLNAYRGLTAGEQEQIRALPFVRHTFTDSLMELNTEINESLPRYDLLKGLHHDGTITEAQKSEFATLANKLEPLSAALLVAAAWIPAKRPFKSRPDRIEVDMFGLFVETARLRHSCVPNAYAHYNPVTGKMGVQVTQDVTAGQELTISLIDGIWFNDAATRQNKLKQASDLACDCTACGSDVGEMYIARKLASTFWDVLQGGEVFAGLSVVDLEKIDVDLTIRSDSTSSFNLGGLKKMGDTITLLLAALEKAGCTDIEPLEWLHALAERIVPRTAEQLNEAERIKAWRSILGHAQKFLEITVRCLGGDAENIERLEGRVEVIRGLVESAEERERRLRESRAKLGM